MDLDHQLESDEHGVLSAFEPTFGDLSGVGYQADVQFGPRHPVDTGFDDAPADENLSDEWLYRATVFEDSTDQAADAAASRPSV